MRVIRKVTKVIKLVVFAGVALVVAILVGLGVVKKYADAPPSSTKAPYLVQTSSRIYLGEKLSTVSGYPELTDYWYLQGSRYYFISGSITFPPSSYGKVEVVSRFGGNN
jgi:hypothetical protein